MILVVSHDAGGAEIIASYVAQQGLECSFVLAGPAVEVFRRRIGAVRVESDVEAAIERCDWLLSGTGWQSRLEWNAIREARRRRRRVVAFLDHWVNYEERFVRDGIQALPDEVWVGDDEALRIARATFPGLPCTLIQNPYLIECRKRVAEITVSRSSSEGATVLFVAEPIRGLDTREPRDGSRLGYTEEDALRFLARDLSLLEVPVERVVVRPHPTESEQKYLWVAEVMPVRTVVRKDRGLLDEIAAADIVVGCETMAMVVGLVAGKRVVSAIPPGGRPCRLPHREIEHLSAMARSA